MYILNAFILNVYATYLSLKTFININTNFRFYNVDFFIIKWLKKFKNVLNLSSKSRFIIFYLNNKSWKHIKTKLF